MNMLLPMPPVVVATPRRDALYLPDNAIAPETARSFETRLLARLS